MKDWTGNSRTTFSTLGASTHSDSEREPHDYYATSPDTIDALARVYDIPQVVCEPSCGEGHLSKRLEALGHKVYSSDLVDRGYGEVKDFFATEQLPSDCACILTNPPYKYLTQYILHSLSLLPINGVLALFVKLQTLEGLERYDKIFKNTPPRYVLPFTGRVDCAPNGDFKRQEKIGSAVAYCWMIWHKGYKGNPEIKWIEYNRRK